MHEQDRSPPLGPAVEPPCGREETAWLAEGEAKACPAYKRWRHGFLPISVDQYLELLDWTGRQLVEGKRGAIDEVHPPILERVGLQPSAWLEMMQKFDVWFHGARGARRGDSPACRPHWAAGFRGNALPGRLHPMNEPPLRLQTDDFTPYLL